MKIIDKTPLQDEKGGISFSARVQGTLKYGLNWFNELEAQKVAITQLDRHLEKGFILIRNFTLPNSDIVIPLILIGAGGIYVIYVTPQKGHFEAKGDQWNTIGNNGKPQPASINLISRVVQLTGAFQKYLNIHKINTPNPVEPVLIAVDPGAHIESLRPAARVVQSDAIKQFAGALSQARPIWNVEYTHVLADRIVDPAPPKEEKPAAPAPAPVEPPRAEAGYNDPNQAQGFDANNLGFAFEDEKSSEPSAPQVQSNPARQAARAQPATGKKKLFGLSNTQIMILAGMFILWCCVMIGFGAFIYLNP